MWSRSFASCNRGKTIDKNLNGMNTEEHLLALPAGYMLGKYRFEGMLGSGGFGITYLAEDTALGRKVAIKELLPNDFATRLDGTTVVAKTRSDGQNLEWARARFLEEGRVLAACSHPNVVEVYEMIEQNGTAYMVTRYEEGQNLENWLQSLNRTPTEEELLSTLFPLLAGLERVHRMGFLHRDIKPQNIYLTTDGRPVLLDFGSARLAIGSRSRMLTAVVTPGYAPFEQYQEAGNQGPWTDIYALGGVMYRAVTGNRPPEATARLLGTDPYKELFSTCNGRYDPSLLKGIDRALRTKESERPQSIAEWRALLPDAGATKPPVIPSNKPWLKRYGYLPIMAAAGVTILVAALPKPWMLAPNPTPAPISSPTPIATPTSISTPISALSPTPLPTPIATPTPLATPTPFPTPTPVLSPTPVAIPSPALSPVATPTPDSTPNSTRTRTKPRQGNRNQSTPAPRYLIPQKYRRFIPFNF
jgi:serine/threonine protein kinase